MIITITYILPINNFHLGLVVIRIVAFLLATISFCFVFVLHYLGHFSMPFALAVWIHSYACNILPDVRDTKIFFSQMLPNFYVFLLIALLPNSVTTMNVPMPMSYNSSILRICIITVIFIFFQVRG